jgi:hypothetical protein
MKKNIYLLFTALSLTFAAKAQNALPNGNFENWTSSSYDEPTGYGSSNSKNKCGVYNCIKIADPAHGSFAIKMTTTTTPTDTCMGYFVNANAGNGSPCSWRGGMPFTQTPTGLRGSFKLNEQTGDSAGIIIAFRSGGSCIGTYFKKFGGVQGSYAQFFMSFTPALSMAPDTMIFAAVSSDIFNNFAVNGSMFQLDSLSFTGISPQPALFNGDFENWTTVTVDSPTGWYTGGGNSQGFNGVAKTTDKQAGVFAAQLTTYLADNNGNPVARAATVSTGYYPNFCGGPCTQIGGYPFSKQTDTLCFYYKYAPMGLDTAQVNLNFKKYGVGNVFSTGMPLSTAANYQYKEVVFNTMNPIDTAIVSFESSSWRDSALSYIGSVLKVDEVHFHSQTLTTGIKMYDASIGVKVFPNPSADGNFVVSNIEQHDLVRVLNVYGQEVSANITKQNGAAQIQINTPGAYFVYLNQRGKITTLKVIVAKN